MLDDPEGTYVIVPVSFNSLADSKLSRGITCTIHSTEMLLIDEVRLPPLLVAHAVIEQVIAKGQLSSPVASDPTMQMAVLDSLFVAVNNHPKKLFGVKMTVELSPNLGSSRAAFAISDVIPPMHKQLVGAFTPRSRRMPTEFRFKLENSVVLKKSLKRTSKSKLRAGQHEPTVVDGYDIHSPVAIVKKSKSFKLSKGSKDEAEYQGWDGGGVGGGAFGGAGAFGGGEAAAPDAADISALMAAFLAAKPG
jgi:hypothetical protein